MFAVAASAAVALAGLYLLLTPDAAGLAAFAWLFVVVGLVGTVLNLVLRGRTRQRPGGR